MHSLSPQPIPCLDLHRITKLGRLLRNRREWRPETLKIIMAPSLKVISQITYPKLNHLQTKTQTQSRRLRTWTHLLVDHLLWETFEDRDLQDQASMYQRRAWLKLWQCSLKDQTLCSTLTWVKVTCQEQDWDRQISISTKDPFRKNKSKRNLIWRLRSLS